MGVVSTIAGKCRRCYACVRACPAGSIKVIAGQATVIEEQCIACGSCVKVCAQKARLIEDASLPVMGMLAVGQPVFACIAPSFPVAFPEASPGSVVTSLRRLGFSQVWEVAFGAELVAREYGRLARQALGNGHAVVSTPCPAVVSYVRKYLPGLRGSLAPVVSPMVAVARAIKGKHGAGVRVVFIGPCIAKKAEIKDPFVQGAVDAALTYEELQALFDAAGIDPATEPPGAFDGPAARLGRSIPISGGLLRTAGIEPGMLQRDVLVTGGRDWVLPALQELEAGKCKARVVDLLFCEGCINGPKMTGSLGMHARRELLVEHVIETGSDAAAALEPVDLARDFPEQPVALARPTEEEIAAALRRMRKHAPEDQLDCGSCGYRSCREKAVAVCRGQAEASMCLPFLVDELEARLARTERLATMGQVSAGVAHEINNPLSTILLYSHLLLKAHQEGDPELGDIRMIVNEAHRCRSIMRGLLDFARQSRLVTTPTDLGLIINDLVDTMNMKLGGARSKVRAEIEGGMPLLPLDGEQIRQMLANLAQNGIDAVESAAEGRVGEVVVSAGLSESRDLLVIRVRDNGGGMPPEVVKEIFTPFYTTKQLGKGTGMGLSIVYGVVKMHAGDIAVDSEVGRGTAFTVRIPISRKTREEAHGLGKDSAAG